MISRVLMIHLLLARDRDLPPHTAAPYVKRWRDGYRSRMNSWHPLTAQFPVITSGAPVPPAGPAPASFEHRTVQLLEGHGLAGRLLAEGLPHGPAELPTGGRPSTEASRTGCTPRSPGAADVGLSGACGWRPAAGAHEG